MRYKHTRQTPDDRQRLWSPQVERVRIDVSVERRGSSPSEAKCVGANGASGGLPGQM